MIFALCQNCQALPSFYTGTILHISHWSVTRHKMWATYHMVMHTTMPSREIKHTTMFANCYTATAATYWCKNHKYLPVTKPEKSSYTKQDVDKVCVQWTGDFITPWDRTKLGKLAFSLAMPYAWNLMPESTADSSILTVNNFVLTTSTVRKLTLCPNIVLNYN